MYQYMTTIFERINTGSTKLSAQEVRNAVFAGDVVKYIRENLFESGSNIKRVRQRSTSGNDIAVSPLASADVTVYIPCARKVAEDNESALSVAFIAKYSGHESLVFTFDRS